jgi:hypothetical protein
MSEMSQMMDLTGKWPYPNILEYHTIQGQHKIHTIKQWPLQQSWRGSVGVAKK